MQPDLWELYRQMLRSRIFEEVVHALWDQGLISGEMHLGTGEEAIAAGVVCQLKDGDALALDHRATPELLMRGVEPVLLLREFLGRPDGLCGGMGGHMHLFSREHLAASSGIVGASGPAGAGFALAAQMLRPGNIAVAFFGEGAANQGMLMESLNLASSWKLPLLFVCKDDRWSITTPSESVTGGDLVERARSFAIPAVRVDGTDVEAVWQAAGEAIQRARRGEGPSFLKARCIHLEGHFLGFPTRRPFDFNEFTGLAGPLLRSVARGKGAPTRSRLRSLKTITDRMTGVARDQSPKGQDPLVKTRQRLRHDPQRLGSLESGVESEISQIIEVALGGEMSQGGS